MFETLLTAIAAFVSTNIDDLFILMALFTQRSERLTKNHIITGQYLGIITLIVISLFGSLIGIVIPGEYIGLLGLFPIYLGLKQIAEYLKKKGEEEDKIDIDKKIKSRTLLSALIAPQALSIATITVANGGDNIGIYVPLFATFSMQQLAITLAIFMACVYIWLMLALYLTSHPMLAMGLRKYNHIVFPLVLIGLGIYILIESGAYGLVFP